MTPMSLLLVDQLDPHVVTGKSLDPASTTLPERTIR